MYQESVPDTFSPSKAKAEVCLLQELVLPVSCLRQLVSMFLKSPNPSFSIRCSMRRNHVKKGYSNTGQRICLQRKFDLFRQELFHTQREFLKERTQMPSLGGGTGEPHECAQMEEAEVTSGRASSHPPKSLPYLSSYLKHSNKHSFI